jgi:hypothetical protein
MPKLACAVAGFEKEKEGEVRVLLVSVAVLDRSAKTWAVVAI